MPEEEEMVVLRQNEGVACFQADAGTTSDTRRFILNVALEDYRMRERSGMCELYVIPASERVRSGHFFANTGRHTIVAAAHGAGVGYWYLVSPIGTTTLIALRSILMGTGIIGTTIAFANSPRLTLERFTFTGTPLGAQITPGKRDSTDTAATALLLTADTGMVITAGSNVRAWLPIAACNNSMDRYEALSPLRRQTQHLFPSWTDPDSVVLRAGEGLLFRQADAGVTAEASSRIVTTDISWQEFTLP
ncbi:MAG: hypothetical protein LC798_21260 [Chloroflexi bacterium]|nr:hypothetical protein [Chloroflexota bacterium]